MDVRGTLLVVAVATLAVVPRGAVRAAPAAESGESPWQIGIAFGYGERSNPLVQSDDIPEQALTARTQQEVDALFSDLELPDH
jgi:hypothetical protein